ncbi:MAG: hypothetical protein IJL31_00675 [Oscillospiraceae bacterium]|nr:hypothetical protein [Oscillospiraceae bacterium]
MKKWNLIAVLLLVALLLAACTDPRPSNEASANAPLPTPSQNGSAAVGAETGPASTGSQTSPSDPASGSADPSQSADPSTSTLPAEESEVYEVTVTAEGEVGMLGDD